MRKRVYIIAALLLAPLPRAAQGQPPAQSGDPIETQPAAIAATLVEPHPLTISNRLPDSPEPKNVAERPCAFGLFKPCTTNPTPANVSSNPIANPTGKHRVADRNFWLVTTGSAGASVLATLGGIHCRHRNGVEPCTEKYGSFAAFEGIRFGFSAIVFPAIGYAWKKEDQGIPHSKWWFIPAAWTAFNVGWAIREFNQGCPGPRLPNSGRCAP